MKKLILVLLMAMMISAFVPVASFAIAPATGGPVNTIDDIDPPIPPIPGWPPK